MKITITIFFLTFCAILFSQELKEYKAIKFKGVGVHKKEVLQYNFL